MDEMLLRVHDLRTYFRSEEGPIKAVDGLSFELRMGETLGIVGESGCGKSVTALSIMRLISPRLGRIAGGSIEYYQPGRCIELTALDAQGTAMRSIRGKEIAMIAQEPMLSLSPVLTIGDQISEAIRLHSKSNKREARQAAIEMLGEAGLPAAAKQVDWYPHQLSAGMQERVVIVMALACQPRLLIADEPTGTLDVTIEAQILDLIKRLQIKRGMAILLLTRNLGIIAEMCQRVIVMYLGKVAESGATDEVFDNPSHPYTQGLLSSLPHTGFRAGPTAMAGAAALLTDLPPGCYFAPRRPQAMAICNEKEPPVFHVNEQHEAKCWLHDGAEH